MLRKLQTYYLALSILCLAGIAWPQTADAGLSYRGGKNMRLSLGLAAMDESDDRFRAGVLAEAAYKRWMTRVQHMARSGDAYKDQITLTTFGYQFGFGKIPFTKVILEGTVGLGLSFQSQEVLVPGAEEKDKATNVGASFGLQFVAPFRRFFASAGWESRLYPTGPATVLLVVARRQSFYIQTGVWL